MPSNSTGQIAIVAHVVAQHAHTFSTQDTIAHVSQIPAGGTALSLPNALPGDGDCYSFADLDGTCSTARPLTIADPNGHPIAGEVSPLFDTAFCWGKLTYDAEARAWSLCSTPAANSSPRPLALATVVDPHDLSGNASDTGPGTAAAPLLTVAELNRRLHTSISASLSIHFTGDVLPGDEELDLTPLDVASDAATVTLTGTPLVLHTGSLTAGTVTMNPAAPGGGQRQIVEDLALGVNGWTPFELLTLVDTQPGPNNGNSLKIAKQVPATARASATAPTAPGGFTAAVTIGDSYRIQRGSQLKLASSAAQGKTYTFGKIQFSDFDFVSLGFVPPLWGGNVTCTRCRVVDPIVLTGASPVLFLVESVTGTPNPFVSTVGSVGPGGIIAPNNGLYFVQGGSDFFDGRFFGLGDVYMTGFGLDIGDSTYSGPVAFSGSPQFQDCTSNAISVLASTNASLEFVLVWGNGNGGFGLTMETNTKTSVTTIPSVTGAAGDFNMDPSGQARAWDDAANAYTALINCTWALFGTAIGAGGFGGQAHVPARNTHLCTG